MEDLSSLDWWDKTSMVTHLILITTVWFLEETRYWLCYFFLFFSEHLSHLSTPTTTIWHHTARHWGPSLSLSPIGQLRHPGASRDSAPIKNNTWTALATLVCDTHRGFLKGRLLQVQVVRERSQRAQTQELYRSRTCSPIVWGAANMHKRLIFCQCSLRRRKSNAATGSIGQPVGLYPLKCLYWCATQQRVWLRDSVVQAYPVEDWTSLHSWTTKILLMVQISGTNIG